MAGSVYPNELVIKINSLEAQQVLAIDLDDDGEEALCFLREKIMGRLRNLSCQPLINGTRANHRCTPGCKSPCCFTGHNLRHLKEQE